MGLLAVFFFWIFGLLTGVSLGAHTPWYAVLGIIAFAVSWVLMRISAERKMRGSAPDGEK